jgi:hypothetical protein
VVGQVGRRQRQRQNQVHLPARLSQRHQVTAAF